MTGTVRLLSSDARPQRPTALSTIADIAALLASDASLDERIAGVVELVRESVGAGECSLWRPAGRGVVRSAIAGDAGIGSALVASLVETGSARAPHTILTRVIAAGRLRGVLAVRVARALDADERLLLTTVANLVGPELAHADRSRELEVEVALRTREMDDQRRFTERIIDSLPVGLYVVDRDYRIQAWNRKRETGMQGVSRDEAIGRPIFDILHRQPAELLQREFDEVFNSGEVLHFHMDSVATGDTRSYKISKIPMRVAGDEVSHVITIGEDVTEWKSAQERFAQAEKLAAIGQLAAGVMHEINNPLATIAVCGETLALRVGELRAAGVPVPAECDDYLRIIDNEVHRCRRIADGLLDFSRPKPLTRASTDLNQVIDQTLFLLKHHSRFKRMTVACALEPGLPLVWANQEQLVQVFMALLINASDAMDAQGAIAVRTARGEGPGTTVVADVIDQGHGIPRSERAKIFEPFYTTKPPGRGTGLGLSICYGIISDHGGRIEVDGAPGGGKGSRFRITLPGETHS